MTRLVYLIVVLLFPAVAVASTTEPVPQPQFVCEDAHMRHTSRLPEAFRLGDEVNAAIANISASYRSEHSASLIDFTVNPDTLPCLSESDLVALSYPVVLAKYGYTSTAPKGCDGRGHGCSIGAIHNITIDAVMSTELIARDHEVMVRWIAAKAICYVQISQNFTDDISDVTEITTARIEYCVSDLVGVAEHLNYYITIQGGYTDEAGRYLAWLQEKYAHPW